jgi:hypothetical protein
MKFTKVDRNQLEKCYNQYCGAERSRIILAEPEPQRDAALAPNLMFNIYR